MKPQQLLVALLRLDSRAWLLLAWSAAVAAVFVYPASAVNSGRKAALYGLGVAHLLVGRDRRLKRSPTDPDVLLLLPPTSVTTTTLLLVRHGESEWNDVFNRGFGPFFPLRLAGALLRELAAWPTPGSLFLDSPLSAVGSHQAANLAKWLAHPRAHADGATAGEERARATLAAVPGGPPSVLATSNLRRSASTAAIALAERLRRTGEAVAVLSSLQEVSPNVDTLALAPPGCPVPCAPPLRCACGYNTGNKPLRSRAGASARLAAFAAWAAAQPPGVTVVAVGHSLWFRAFLDAYLPRGAAGVDARRRKLANCGVLAMTLQSAPTAGGGAGGMLFRIPPESVVNVYGGWSAK